MNKNGKTSPIVVVLIALLVVAIVGIGWFGYTQLVQQTAFDEAEPGDIVQGGYEPSATYETQDAWASTSISGTSYYKRGTDPASTTAITVPVIGEKYTYWVQNNTHYWVRPYNFIGKQTNNEINKEGYHNGTMTITTWDVIGSQKATAGANNATLTTGTASLRFTLQGTNKYSAIPFGGLFVVEYNNTISDVVCNGDGVAPGNPSNFALTYTPYATTHVYKTFELVDGFDDGTGAIRDINCQFTGGSTSPGADAPLLVKVIPANYYVGQDGNFYLDTEKKADSDTTRVGSTVNLPSDTALGFN